MAAIRRRTFLKQGASAIIWVRAAEWDRLLPEEPAGGASMAATPAAKPVADIHIHLFGTGDGGSGCRLSKSMTRSLVFKFLELVLGLGRRGAGRDGSHDGNRDTSRDARYVEVLVDTMRLSGLDRGVLLAHDGVYDAAGKLDDSRTHVYVPNDYLWKIVEAHPDLFIPCVSINPNRRDALDELQRWASRGVRLLKIHPPIQGVDLADRRHSTFLSRCAELHILVLVHTGHEHSAPIVDAALADPLKLEQALDLGCAVVACHSGTGSPFDAPDFVPGFVRMARRYSRLWGETSILGNPGRGRDVGRLLREKDLLPRFLHGSDFPFPSVPVAFSARIGLWKAAKLQAVRNPLRRDLELKVALGFGRQSAERALDLAGG